jgi:hypothetical protein
MLMIFFKPASSKLLDFLPAIVDSNKKSRILGERNQRPISRVENVPAPRIYETGEHRVPADNDGEESVKDGKHLLDSYRKN